MEAAIHAGVAVELMAKAVIASHDPSQVFEDGKPGSARTIGASKAVRRAAALVVEMARYLNQAIRTLDARNASAHAAELDDGELSAHILEGTQFILVAAEALTISPRRFLGPELHQQVLAEIAGHTTALRVASEKLVAAANLEYRRLTSLVSPGKLAEVLRARDHGPQHGDVDTQVECPACSNLCWAYWRVDVDVEYEGPDDYQVEPVLAFLGIDCPFCYLQLSASQCDSISFNPNGDPAEYFEVEL